MVCHGVYDGHHRLALSVLALSSRFDGPTTAEKPQSLHPLSVLALSSRFDGLAAAAAVTGVSTLSVLALSSRFDGQSGCQNTTHINPNFQYSLCRVVLMVAWQLRLGV